MSKIAMNSTKYLIVGEFKTKGLIDKPDLIGAFFGQTEGLIGENLEFQNLQKTGKLGRIEIDIKENEGNSFGEFKIPTSLDKIEVSLVAAAIESIEKIGHCTGKIKIKKVIDVREDKRKEIYKRAKEILENIKKELPNSNEISYKLNKDTLKAKIKEYDKEIYGGPNIYEEDEIILVEGRADVLNLLENGIENVICFNGSNIPKFIINLTKTKITTAFLDDDRGGEKELEELIKKADIDYFCFAPLGKEVENLSYKEIIKSLKNKISVSKEKESRIQDNILNKIKNIIPQEINVLKKKENKEKKNKTDKNFKKKEKINNENSKSFFSKKEFDKVLKIIKKAKSSNQYFLLNENFRKIDEDKIGKINNIKNKNGSILIFNGICENMVLNLAKEKNIDLIICKSKAKIKNYNNIKVKLFDDFLKDNK